MNLNNKKLIEILLSWGVSANIMVDMLSSIWLLTKRHGKILYTQKYIDSVSKVDNNLWHLLLILKKTNKMTQKDIKHLIELIKSSTDNYKKEFIISTNIENKTINEHLKSKFNDSQIETKLQDNLWIKISWEWWYFKKDLDLDLQKLLW